MSIIIDALRAPTERDKQIKVGASNLSNPCTKCLVEDFLGLPKTKSRFDMGAVIGTAVHSYVEKCFQGDERYLLEHRVDLGELGDYGNITSRWDIFDKETGTLYDVKTTTQSKLKSLKRAFTEASDEYDTTAIKEARYTANRYLAQISLYARGAELEGYEVENVALTFLCRDGSQFSQHAWEFNTEYREEWSEIAWTRAEEVWELAKSAEDLEDVPFHDFCWYCNNVRF